jgi:exosortase
MPEPMLSFDLVSLRPHLLFGAFVVASVALFRVPLRELAALALSSDPYSYILLVPLISAFILYLERRKVFAGIGTHPYRAAGARLAGTLVIYGCLAMGVATPPAEYVLSIKVVSILSVWVAAFSFCYGNPALKAARFALLLLLLLVPIPSHVMERVVIGLQWASADATYTLFRLVRVPVFRTGVDFELPVVTIEVAKECSSIHSACALFITGILVGHLFLKSLKAKVCLTLLAIPIAIFTNAVRITTLWFLAIKVDIGFLYGNLHHNGGIVFSLVSLSILISCLYLLRKLEGSRHLAVR